MKQLILSSLFISFMLSTMHVIVFNYMEPNIFPIRIFLLYFIGYLFLGIIFQYLFIRNKIKSKGIPTDLKFFEPNQEIQVTSNHAPETIFPIIERDRKFFTWYKNKLDNELQLSTSKSNFRKQLTTVSCSENKAPFHYTVSNKVTSKLPITDGGENTITVFHIKQIIESQAADQSK